MKVRSLSSNPNVPGTMAEVAPFRSTTGGVPWRSLVVLTLLVLAAHWLVLRVPASRVGPLQAPDVAAKAFITRSVAPQAVTPVMPLPEVGTAVTRLPPKKASKQPPPHVPYASSAIDSIANSAPDNQPAAPPEPPATPADSAPSAHTAAVADIIGSPLPAVSAAVSATVSTAAAAVQSAQPPPANAAVASTGPAPTVVTAISLPGSARLQYKVTGSAKGLNYFADSELNWSNAGTRYDASMKVSALFIGSRTMTSTGALTPTGLAPSRFADRYKSELAAHFEADKGRVTFSANTPDVPWVDGTQDRVSVFLQLGGMLAAGPGGAPGTAPAGFGVGSSITLYTVGPRDADTWTFVVEAAEQLSLLGGDMATLKLTRQPRREYDQKVEVWYAPSLGFLPVRNRITQANGDSVDQQITAVTRP
ncbi:MAG: DUF3108 domain-containing protein [Polaromonas sp.]|nr:MAG: DUF3108 domain-containing protein [Polaromonas sp.]